MAPLLNEEPLLLLTTGTPDDDDGDAVGVRVGVPVGGAALESGGGTMVPVLLVGTLGKIVTLSISTAPSELVRETTWNRRVAVVLVGANDKVLFAGCQPAGSVRLNTLR